MLSAKAHLVHLAVVQVFVVSGAATVSLLSAWTMGPEGRGVLGFGTQLSYFLSWVVVVGVDRAIPSWGAGAEWVKSFHMAVRLILIPLALLILAAAICFAAATRIESPWGVVLGVALIHCLFMSILACVRISSAAAGIASPVEASAVTYAILSVGSCVVLMNVGISSPTLWLLGLTIAAGAPAIGVLTFATLVGESGRQPTDDVRLSARGHALGSFAMILVTRGYRVLMVPLAGAPDLGLYLAVATLCDLVLWPVHAAFEVGLPRAVQLRGLPMRELWLYVSLTLAGSILALLILLEFGESLILLALGASFVGATVLLFPLLIAAGAFACSRLFLLQIIANRWDSRWFEGIIVSLWFPCFVLSTAGFGALGAAWSKAAVLVALAIGAGIVVHRRSRGHV